MADYSREYTEEQADYLHQLRREEAIDDIHYKLSFGPVPIWEVTWSARLYGVDADDLLQTVFPYWEYEEELTAR